MIGIFVNQNLLNTFTMFYELLLALLAARLIEWVGVSLVVACIKTVQQYQIKRKDEQHN